MAKGIDGTPGDENNRAGSAADAGSGSESDHEAAGVRRRCREGARAVAKPGTSNAQPTAPRREDPRPVQALDMTTKLYMAARTGERQLARAAESERLPARQSQGAKLKP